VVARLVEIAKSLRGARRRHEQLGLTVDEAAFYDALAGGIEAEQADPQLAAIAHDLVQGVRADLSVDWADRESSEAAIRVKIKRLLRKHKYKPSKQSGAGGGPDDLTTSPSSSSTKPRRSTGTIRKSRGACSNEAFLGWL
jgi:type I restriction enzyme R subunit